MNSLTSLADRIRDEHALASASARDAITHAIAAGKLLLEAKAAVAHGEWLPWLAANCDLSERQAQRYIRVARKAPALLEANPTRGTDLSIRGALGLLATPAKPKSDITLPFELTPNLWAETTCRAYDGGEYSVFVIASSAEPNETGLHWFYLAAVFTDVWQLKLGNRANSGCSVEGSKKPIRADYVIHMLDHIVSGDWRRAEWESFECEPIDYNPWLYSSEQNYIDLEILGK